MKFTGLIFASLVLLPGCDTRNLYVAHDTVLGINAVVNQGRQKGQLVVGYDRDFATVIPKSVDPTSTGEKDAMALVNCTELEIDGIYLNAYSDVMITGDAAVAHVKSGALTPSKFDCEIEEG
ncbi:MULTISPECIES: hypothetical protein [unclassified Roseovarius]|uniref:hypothetical protein n=1 Tax=unclassified Roseovarius TaxID=2614913 RepID=UPI00273D74C1|nr:MULTISPECIES: hypothetical protein [unclassified Roseovarius]